MVKSKRIQISFAIKKDPEEELILNLLDSLSPSKRAELIMSLLKKYTNSQLAKENGIVKILTGKGDLVSSIKKEEARPAQKISAPLVEEELSTEILTKEIGESPEQFKPEEKSKNPADEEEFEESLRIARKNIGLLNKSKR